MNSCEATLEVAPSSSTGDSARHGGRAVGCRKRRCSRFGHALLLGGVPSPNLNHRVRADTEACMTLDTRIDQGSPKRGNGIFMNGSVHSGLSKYARLQGIEVLLERTRAEG